VRPGPVGRRGLVDAMLPRNFVYRLAGANPARPRVSPPEPVASLAPFLETSSAKRRHANVWAMGNAAPKPIVLPDAEGPELPEGNNNPLHRWLGEEGGVSGGVLDHGTYEEDGPVTWEALASPRQSPVLRRAGDSSPTHGTYAGTRVVGLTRHRTRSPHRGRSQARGTGAVAEGGRESEGCIGAMTSGNGLASRTRPSKGGPC
jgi:hypothetical protein